MSLFCTRRRTCLLSFTCIVGFLCVTFLWTIEDNSGVNGASWNRIVSRTQKHLLDLKHSPRTDEADVYLRMLGFEPEEYTKYVWTPSSSSERRVGIDEIVDKAAISGGNAAGNLSSLTPTVAIAVQSGELEAAFELFDSIRQHMSSEWRVYFYDMKLGYYERSELISRCANAPTVCRVRHLDLSLFPAHVSQFKYGAYRPLIIQNALNDSGLVLYVSPRHRLRSDLPPGLLTKVKRVGVVGWRLNDSTSALTHPKTFAYFRTEPQNYYFHHAVYDDLLVVHNTERVRRRLMFPWLQCVLQFRCLSPLGAQDTGCRQYRKPLYLYSGCHHYDLSILNVVLGTMTQFDATPYVVDPRLTNFVATAADSAPLQ